MCFSVAVHQLTDVGVFLKFSLNAYFVLTFVVIELKSRMSFVFAVTKKPHNVNVFTGYGP